MTKSKLTSASSNNKMKSNNNTKSGIENLKIFPRISEKQLYASYLPATVRALVSATTSPS